MGSNWIHRVRKLRSELRTGGVRRVAMMARLWLLSSDDRRFEHQYGLNTRAHVELDALRIASANLTHGFSYAPAPGRIVNHFIDSLALDPRQTSFVDFGSGKGRALIHASFRGFRQVIGVEFSDQLVNIARHNAARFHDLRAGDTLSLPA